MSLFAPTLGDCVWFLLGGVVVRVVNLTPEAQGVVDRLVATGKAKLTEAAASYRTIQGSEVSQLEADE